MVADVIIVSAPVKRFGHLDFLDLVWTMGLTFGPVRTGDLDLDLGLTIYCPACSTCDSMPAGNLPRLMFLISNSNSRRHFKHSNNK